MHVTSHTYRHKAHKHTASLISDTMNRTQLTSTLPHTLTHKNNSHNITEYTQKCITHTHTHNSQSHNRIIMSIASWIITHSSEINIHSPHQLLPLTIAEGTHSRQLGHTGPVITTAVEGFTAITVSQPAKYSFAGSVEYCITKCHCGK